MPRQNRVTPEGVLIADPARGMYMGNRGILHDAAGRLGKARFQTRAWITCALSFKDRKLPLMDPGHNTQLFFLDEAVSLTAGHRPCALCRRANCIRFRAAWAEAGLGVTVPAPAMDACLHRARIDASTKRQLTHIAPIASLPDGCFIRQRSGPGLILGGQLWPCTAQGYTAPRRRPSSGSATVLTPAPILRILAAGYRPVLHPSIG